MCFCYFLYSANHIIIMHFHLQMCQHFTALWVRKELIKMHPYVVKTQTTLTSRNYVILCNTIQQCIIKVLYSFFAAFLQEKVNKAAGRPVLMCVTANMTNNCHMLRASQFHILPFSCEDLIPLMFTLSWHSCHETVQHFNMTIISSVPEQLICMRRVWFHPMYSQYVF